MLNNFVFVSAITLAENTTHVVHLLWWLRLSD